MQKCTFSNTFKESRTKLLGSDKNFLEKNNDSLSLISSNFPTRSTGSAGFEIFADWFLGKDIEFIEISDNQT